MLHFILHQGASSGWLTWLYSKRKNEAHLPDDKNKSVSTFFQITSCSLSWSACLVSSHWLREYLYFSDCVGWKEAEMGEPGWTRGRGTGRNSCIWNAVSTVHVSLWMMVSVCVSEQTHSSSTHRLPQSSNGRDEATRGGWSRRGATCEHVLQESRWVTFSLPNYFLMRNLSIYSSSSSFINMYFIWNKTLIAAVLFLLTKTKVIQNYFH